MARNKFGARKHAVCRGCGASLPLAPRETGSATRQGDVWIAPGGEILMARDPEACPSCGEPWRGFVADSGAEARRFAALLVLERAGTISGLLVHPRYPIMPAYRDRMGVYHSGREYEADFAYREGTRDVVEDVKGVATEAFEIRSDLFRLRYPHLEFRIVPAGEVE